MRYHCDWNVQLLHRGHQGLMDKDRQIFVIHWPAFLNYLASVMPVRKTKNLRWNLAFTYMHTYRITIPYPDSNAHTFTQTQTQREKERDRESETDRLFNVFNKLLPICSVQLLFKILQNKRRSRTMSQKAVIQSDFSARALLHRTV